MKNKICIAGNIVLDLLYPISGYPTPGKLTTITEIGKSVGGSVCNVGIDIARLMPDVKVSGLGLVGEDENGDYVLERLNAEGLDTSTIYRKGSTSFTAVMSDNFTRERTFFHFRGANAEFCEDSFRWDDIDCDILHIAYILLLDALDVEDDEYGTKMARLLAHAKERGIRTSIDVVSESGERFMKLVPPALKYTDYCIINEIEASESTGIPLRGEDGATCTTIFRKLSLPSSTSVSANGRSSTAPKAASAWIGTANCIPADRSVSRRTKSWARSARATRSARACSVRLTAA